MASGGQRGDPHCPPSVAQELVVAANSCRSGGAPPQSRRAPLRYRARHAGAHEIVLAGASDSRRAPWTGPSLGTRAARIILLRCPAHGRILAASSDTPTHARSICLRLRI